MVNFYHSYWSGGYHGTPSQYIIDMYKLSCLYVKKWYGDCYLITDSKSVDLFKDIPYSKISTELNEIQNIKTPNWALGKILSYKILSERKEKFIHLDYDVFFLKQIPLDLFNNEIVVQSIEENIYDEYALKHILNYNQNYLLTPTKTDQAFNMGIFGGSDFEFISYYSNKAIQFTLDSTVQNMLNDMQLTINHGPACTIEQYYLWQLTQRENKKVKCLINGSNLKNKVLNKSGKNLGYVHLQGTKNDKKVRSALYNRLNKFNVGI